ncbi:aminoglycoside phosphotransferase family protein [Rhizobium leguminosarum]|uniref:aminoglycoside phosphotransferase family protein n=1 Tax=Rhizobium leguminosarum TaxID=384 RepID=UPI001C94F31B|nr:aminoglycoside phosphotransferase family protein [Rhizobium leguminosarum]MBY5655145.1 aminoglycoside phosphotransferase family protein [Rhizobium leguminosarum]
MKLLEGGRTGQIWQDGNTVIRPSGAWTPTVHRFLRHLGSRGFLGAPDAIEITGDREVVGYVTGRVCEDLSDQFVGSQPYNVATADHEAVGIIDFDTAHPAPRLWDLAYSVYRWAPLSDPANPDVTFGLDEQLHRAEIFCTAYGATMEDRLQLPEMICRRLQALVDFMLASASAGDETFVEDVVAGDARLYLSDMDYVRSNRDRLLKALC